MIAPDRPFSCPADELAGIARRRARILDAYEREAIDAGELQARLAKLDAERGRIEREAADAERTSEAARAAADPGRRRAWRSRSAPCAAGAPR